MTDQHAVCRQLEASIPFVLQRISAKAFLERSESKIREDATIQQVAKRSGARSSKTTIIALGKMASSMAFEFVQRFDLRDVQGVVSAPYESNVTNVSGLEYFAGGHPVPNEASFSAAAAALKLLENLSPQDVVIYLVSGGGSACFELPDSRINLADIQSAYSTLISCGAGIREVNAVRQRLSQVKGGKLAGASGTEYQLSLIVSDVPDNDLQFVSSGPSVAADSSWNDIQRIEREFSLAKSLPASVNQVLADSAMSRNLPRALSNSMCIGSNEDAIVAAEEYFRGLGWHCKVDRSYDAAHVDIAVPGLLKSLESLNLNGPCCVIAGGEVVSPVIGKGRGGRNQAFVLQSITQIADRNTAIMSFATDGKDGNSPAAGAIVDSSTMEQCKQLGIDIAQVASESNSYEASAKLGKAIETGATGSNVCDLRILVRCS